MALPARGHATSAPNRSAPSRPLSGAAPRWRPRRGLARDRMSGRLATRRYSKHVRVAAMSVLTLATLRSLSPSQRAEVLVSRPEDQWFDRKSARVHARDIAATLIGFANAEGGLIAVGIHGGGFDAEVDIEAENTLRQSAVDFTVPPVPLVVERLTVETGQGASTVLLLEVGASDRLHTTVRDEAYLRIGDEVRRLTFDQRRELAFDKGQSNFEVTPARILRRSDLDDDLLGDLARRLGSTHPDRFLAARGLAATGSDVATMGAVLLFAATPQAELPEAHVRVLRYRGVVRDTGRRQQIVEDVRIEGPLPTQIERARDLVVELLPRRRALDSSGRFSDVPAIPADAWMEGLVNAVTHRSYSMVGDHIRVEIFDDRTEVTSPGRFPGVIDVQDPRRITRFARNPRIARMLADLHFGQELGEGIRRMFEEMRLAGLAEPHYLQTSGNVTLVLASDPVDRDLERQLSAEARILVRGLRDAGRLSTGDLVALVGRSRPAVLRDLDVLRRAGVVEWHGTSKKDPRAYWQLPR